MRPEAIVSVDRAASVDHSARDSRTASGWRSQGIAARVVSMPSWELLDAQPDEYREALFPSGVPVVAVEAGVALGWERFAERTVSIDRFGASAPGDEVLRRLGVTSEAVTTAVLEVARRRAPRSS